MSNGFPTVKNANQPSDPTRHHGPGGRSGGVLQATLYSYLRHRGVKIGAYTKQPLNEDNTRIWQTYYEPKPLSTLYTGWQEMLAEHRQIVVQVQEIAGETGWRGPEEQVRLLWG